MFLTQDPNNCRNQSLKKADDLYHNIKVRAPERPIIRMNGFCNWKMVYWPTWPPREPSEGQDGWRMVTDPACPQNSWLKAPAFSNVPQAGQRTHWEEGQWAEMGLTISHPQEPRHSTEPWDILQQGTSNNSEEQMNTVLFAAWGFLKPYIQGGEFWKVNHFWSQWQDLWPTSGPEQGISRFCCEWKVSVHKSQIGKHSIYMINSTSYKRMDKNAK